MRKFLLTLFAMTVLTASAEEKQRFVRIDNYSITTDAAGNETATFSGSSAINYYDEDNVLVMDQSSYSRNFYTYNADGTVAASDVYSWSSTTGWTKSTSSCKTYEYDGDGNVTKLISGSGSFTRYSDYQHGCYGKMENCSADGTAYYTSIYVNTFNEKNQRTRCEQQSAAGVAQMFTTYTYDADGRLASTHQAYYDADGNESTSNYSDVTYSYNLDNTIHKTRTVSNGRWGLTTMDQVYVYANYSTEYTPRNVKAVAGESNTVTVSWDAHGEASKYVVIYDQKADTVTTTSYTTPSLLDGAHDFYVQIVKSDVARNISAAATVTVADLGKLPAKNFKVVEVNPTETSWGSKAYEVKAQFSLPEGHSEVTGYKVCYGSGDYDNASVALGDATVDGNNVSLAVTLGEYAVSDYDTDVYEYVPRQNVPLCVIVCYVTGDSERSNVEGWNFAENVSSVSAVSVNATVVGIYTIDGIKVNKLQKGINIVKMSDGTTVKVLRK